MGVSPSFTRVTYLVPARETDARTSEIEATIRADRDNIMYDDYHNFDAQSNSNVGMFATFVLEAR